MKLFSSTRSRVFSALGCLLAGLPFLLLSSCSRPEQEPTIDVSSIWETDWFGLPLNGRWDSQWENKSLSSGEMKLFASLDTAGLSGTTAPLRMEMTDRQAFPNPFLHYFELPFGFNQEFSGKVVLKYVIVDHHLTPLQQGVVRLSAASGRAMVAIAPGVPAGDYRLYFSLSSQANPHFYKSWGNIRKTR
ncbi:hypothetical protein [Tellurirhabdus rosea]|uniref:hypothetical protein n=1 Tax=Tellurirhabdus rosea TaxID=2674997 RepID=UPI00225018F1|nr:hypothetical protein [Tellurirhabdus rosea]